jgi:hypothetical protein
MNKPQTNGWGAYQNKKTEIDKLKRQLVVQDVNNYGEVMTIDKKYNFKPVYTTVNSFRFSNLIKNEEICEIFKKPDNKIEISIPILEDNVKLTITDISESQPNVDLNTCDKIPEFDEMDIYKTKLFNNTLIINGLIEEIQKNKVELEEKIKLLTETYNNQMIFNNNKIVKLQKYNDALQNMMELKLNLLEIENDITLQDIIPANNSNTNTNTNLEEDDNDKSDSNSNSEESDSEESESEDDSDSDDKSNSVTETVPDEFSIINIMKKTYEKQKLEEQQKQTATIIKDYDNTIITVDDVNYMFIREHWYKHTQYQYRAYKLDNGRNNKIRSNSNNKRKCCHRNCGRHLGWVTINEERQYSCHDCDKLIINHDSIIKYNNKMYLPKDISCLNDQSLHGSRKWEIDHDLHVYLLKKDERIIINNEISLEIYWFYNGEKYIYKESYGKEATKYKTAPIIIYNDITLVCETDVKYYKVKINGIYMNFLRDV